MKIRYFLTAILPVATILSTSAQEVSSPAAMQFLNLNPDPVSMAMGGTSRNGAYAHFGSVAGAVDGAGTLSVAASYGLFQPTATSSDLISAGAVYRIDDRFAVTFGFLGEFGKRYDVTDGIGAVIGDCQPFDFRAGAGFSWKSGMGLSAGVTLNYAQSAPYPEIDGEREVLRTGFADVQVRYQLPGNVGISLHGRNLGIPVKSDEGDSFGLPANIALSADGNWTCGKNSFVAAVDAGMYFNPAVFNFGAGVEYGYDGHYFLRAGGHFCGEGTGIPGYVSAGAGIRFCGFTLDLSWNWSQGPMKNSFSAGIGYSF